MPRILCIDDDPAAVALRCQILENAGHQATASFSLKDAMEKLREQRFDAVVTDWRIGQQNGHAIVEAAKRFAAGPVIVVSGYVSEAFQAAEPLADLYLNKPVNPEELLQVLEALLKSGREAGQTLLTDPE